MSTDTGLSHGPHFDIRTTTIGEVLVLAVHGDLDALTAPQLAEAITASLAGYPSALVVDLSELDFLASAGMSVLINGRQDAGSASRFVVVADGPSTSRPMEVIGLDLLLSVHPTLDAALTHLR